MPDNFYFKQPATQKILSDVLFVWAKLHPDVSYRQGMHELAATVLWVVERDAVGNSQSNEVPSHRDEELANQIFSSDYTVHDTFDLFAAIMRIQKAAFNHTSLHNEQKRDQQSMIGRCRHIIEAQLARVDPALSKHLLELEISPQLYLMWVPFN